MASLLKRRWNEQWAGEKISSRDKTIVADEFKDIEQDIELRKEGILKCVSLSQNCIEPIDITRDKAAGSRRRLPACTF